MIRHDRLGVTRWELPGGHVDGDEALEETAVRECLEETGVSVSVGCLLATCVHEWYERRSRKLICFFDATATSDTPRVRPEENNIREAAWLDPLILGEDAMSAFLHPLITQQRRGWVDAPIYFRMTHQKTDGVWTPVPVDT